MWQVQRYQICHHIRTDNTHGVGNGGNAEVCHSKVDDELLADFIDTADEGGHAQDQGVATCPHQQGRRHDGDVDHGKLPVALQ